VGIGLLVLYLPSLYDLFLGIWSSDEQMHGPLVLGVSIWLLHRKWAEMESASVGRPTSLWGWPIFVFGCLLYSIGRSQGILVLEIGSVVWLIAALILLHWGVSALKVQWFALFTMLFMVPLPVTIVDLVTQPMKMAVSYAAENILYWAGYPVWREGVVLQVGQYMLMVADACAGLHTLLTLELMGLLYLHIVQRDSFFRNTTLAILIVPISFTANVIRVIVLCLITYHFGDAAGQGFLHGFAGMVLFISALLLIVGVDSALHAIEDHRRRHRVAGSVD
jgi:exosortase B